MRLALGAVLLLASAPSALAAEAGDAAKQTYTCAGAAGLASELLEKSDPAGARQLSARAQELARSGVQQEMSRGIVQGDAVTAMTTFLTARATIYRADPTRPVSDLAACRARGMIPAGPRITAAQVAAAAGVPVPPSARQTPPPARAAAPARPAVSPDAEFRRFVSGPWGRTKGGQFDSEMIVSSVNKPTPVQFTRRACPADGLASHSEMLAHEIWFEERPGGEFGIVRASGDPGKVTTSWTRLTFKDQPAADSWRYEFYNNFMMTTATLTLQRLGPDQLSHLVNVPGAGTLGGISYFGRCRRR